MKSTPEILLAISKEGSFSERLKKPPYPPEVEGCLSVCTIANLFPLSRPYSGRQSRARGTGTQVEPRPPCCGAAPLVGSLFTPPAGGPRIARNTHASQSWSLKGQDPHLHMSDSSQQREVVHTRVILVIGEDKHPSYFIGNS